MRVVSLESPLKGHQPLKVFNFFLSLLNILKDFKVLSRFMQNGIQSSCLFGSRFACAQATIFFTKPYSINAGDTSIVLWIAPWEWRSSSFCNPNQNRAALWRIFSSNKSAHANRKTGFYANREPNKQEIGFIFAWSCSELWTLIKY